MTKLRVLLFALAGGVCALSGCDGVSRIENESSHPLTVRYWHTDYDRWSPTMKSEPRGAIVFPPGHHLRDVSCLEITEGVQRIVYDHAALGDIQTLCRKTNACTLRYLGAGRLNASGSGGASTEQNHTRPSDKPCRA